MSAFREAAAVQLQNGLVCPACTAMNRPGIVTIEVSQDWLRAFCTVCAITGPITSFQPKPKE